MPCGWHVSDQTSCALGAATRPVLGLPITSGTKSTDSFRHQALAKKSSVLGWRWLHQGERQFFNLLAWRPTWSKRWPKQSIKAWGGAFSLCTDRQMKPHSPSGENCFPRLQPDLDSYSPRSGTPSAAPRLSTVGLRSE